MHTSEHVTCPIQMTAT